LKRQTYKELEYDLKRYKEFSEVTAKQLTELKKTNEELKEENRKLLTLMEDENAWKKTLISSAFTKSCNRKNDREEIQSYELPSIEHINSLSRTIRGVRY